MNTVQNMVSNTAL